MDLSGFLSRTSFVGKVQLTKEATDVLTLTSGCTVPVVTSCLQWGAEKRSAGFSRTLPVAFQVKTNEQRKLSASIFVHAECSSNCNCKNGRGFNAKEGGTKENSVLLETVASPHQVTANIQKQQELPDMFLFSVKSTVRTAGGGCGR